MDAGGPRTLRALLRHPDTARCAQGAVMVAQEFLRLRGRPATQPHTEGVLALASHLTSRLFPASAAPDAEARFAPLDDHAGLVDKDELRPMVAQEFERAVPASKTGRVLGFGQLGASLAMGTVGAALRQPFGQTGKDMVLSEANSERIAATLCRMRGAALKFGQMLSIQDETVLPPQLSAALERVRQNADIMPAQQLAVVMREELGQEWRGRFQRFNERPFAAASLGQVHQAWMQDGTPVAVKVQFPGVAESIDSDLDNLQRLASATGLFPRGLFVDRIVEVMKEELGEECDYEQEARHQIKFRDLLADATDDFFVPQVIREASSRRVLTTQLARGRPIDRLGDELSQEERNAIGFKLLKLTLRELFEFRYMQTDPNFSNYLYDTELRRIVLLDFGATRSFGQGFVDDYLELVWAASRGDRSAILDYSIKLGFLTGNESQAMINAHVEAGLQVGAPFQRDEPYDFRASRVAAQVGKHGETFMNERLTPPPREVYALHRKLSGAYMACIRIGAVFPCKELLERAYAKHSVTTRNNPS